MTDQAQPPRDESMASPPGHDESSGKRAIAPSDDSRTSDANGAESGGALASVAPRSAADVSGPTDEADGESLEEVTTMVQQPAKVMRIGTMIKQLLEEVRAAPLDESGRARL